MSSHKREKGQAQEMRQSTHLRAASTSHSLCSLPTQRMYWNLHTHTHSQAQKHAPPWHIALIRASQLNAQLNMLPGTMSDCCMHAWLSCSIAGTGQITCNANGGCTGMQTGPSTILQSNMVKCSTTATTCSLLTLIQALAVVHAIPPSGRHKASWRYAQAPHQHTPDHTRKSSRNHKQDKEGQLLPQVHTLPVLQSA